MTTYQEAKRELWFWKHGPRTGNWSNLFFTLLNKSDWEHKTRLEQAFPCICKVFRDWQEAKSEDEFFKDVEDVIRREQLAAKGLTPIKPDSTQ